VANCVFSGRQTKTQSFTLDERHSAIYDDSHQQRLAVLLTSYFDETLQVRIDINNVESGTETPAAYIARCQQQRMAEAEATITNDTLVNQLIKQFNAEIVQGSITPIDHPLGGTTTL
jgi:DNA polymerase-3 subunit gamma/tau